MHQGPLFVFAIAFLGVIFALPFALAWLERPHDLWGRRQQGPDGGTRR